MRQDLNPRSQDDQLSVLQLSYWGTTQICLFSTVGIVHTSVLLNKWGIARGPYKNSGIVKQFELCFSNFT